MCVLCADGIMIEKGFYTPDLLDKFATIVRDVIGFTLTFTQKDMNQGYGSILDKSLITTQSADMAKEIITGVLDSDDSGAADIILKHYPHWKCCNNTLYVFDDSAGMWSNSVDVQNRIITSLSQHLDIVKQTKNGLELTGKNYANCNFKRREMFSYIRQNCVDEDWLMRSQSTSLGKVLFKNGHYDFTNSVFHYGHKY